MSGRSAPAIPVLRTGSGLGIPVLRTGRGIAWGTGLALLAGLLGACSASRSTLLVEVRDAATGEPAAGASVVADVPSRNHPFSVASLLGQTGELATRSAADGRGRARVEYLAGRPVRLGVLEPGWDTGFVLLDPDAPGFAAEGDGWISGQTPPIDGARRPEFRVVR